MDNMVEGDVEVDRIKEDKENVEFERVMLSIICSQFECKLKLTCV